jgi:hypothetical protein
LEPHNKDVIIGGMDTIGKIVRMEIVRKKDSNEKGPEPGTGGVEIVVPPTSSSLYLDGSRRCSRE